jgi:hypothetical protein
VSDAGQEAHEKAWKRLNIQVDTMLKMAETRYGPWKVGFTGMAAGGALVAGTPTLMISFTP